MERVTDVSFLYGQVTSDRKFFQTMRRASIAKVHANLIQSYPISEPVGNVSDTHNTEHISSKWGNKVVSGKKYRSVYRSQAWPDVNKGVIVGSGKAGA